MIGLRFVGTCLRSIESCLCFPRLILTDAGLLPSGELNEFYSFTPGSNSLHDLHPSLLLLIRVVDDDGLALLEYACELVQKDALASFERVIVKSSVIRQKALVESRFSTARWSVE